MSVSDALRFCFNQVFVVSVTCKASMNKSMRLSCVAKRTCRLRCFPISFSPEVTHCLMVLLADFGMSSTICNGTRDRFTLNIKLLVNTQCGLEDLYQPQWTHLLRSGLPGQNTKMLGLQLFTVNACCEQNCSLHSIQHKVCSTMTCSTLNTKCKLLCISF